MFKNFRTNIKPLIGSVVFALILWFMVATEKTYSHQITIPLEIVRMKTGKTLLDPVPENVTIEVEGKGRSLIGAWLYDVAFRLELANFDRSRSIELKDYLNFLDLPSNFNLKVVEVIEPTSIDLLIDDLITVEKPVRMSGSIIPEAGFTMIHFGYDSEMVKIRGPKSKVQKIDAVMTELVGNEKRKSSFSQELVLVNPEPGIMEVSPVRVRMDVDIQRLVEHIIYNIPIKIKNAPAHLNVTATPPVLALKVKGGEKVVAAIKPEEIIAEIDFPSHYRPDVKNYAVSIVTPTHISWIESIPQIFSLQVKKK
ncbi:MAG: YbbR-like domain-containing protein [Calditrichales bacterium]|nr:MAG: YbbR-like domain-containing protein [Calditrichales bacterium]